MSSYVSSFLTPYAQSVVLYALRGISGSRIKLITRYETPPKVINIGDGKDEVTVTVNHPNFWMRICSCFDLGFAEAYMFQEADCDDLRALFHIYIKNKSHLGSGNILFQLLPRLAWYFQPANNIQLARQNASSHYDTSNDLFAAFLSPDMNYSCAHWSDDPAESLSLAQDRKVRHVLEKAQLSSSHHLLDIGCGWGDVAIKAVQTTGCRVTGLTLAAEQKKLAETKIKAAGLQDRIEILLCDYRNIPLPAGKKYYDRVVSIEMLEHVGPQFMETYFGVISDLLAPGGVMVVDGTTMTNLLHNTMATVPTFIDRYIFPGGYLPTIQILLNALHRGSKGELEVTSVRNIGPHYGRTLLAWRDNFLYNWNKIQADYRAALAAATDAEIEAFRRQWLYYFEYCEAGFASRQLGNYLIAAEKMPGHVV